MQEMIQPGAVLCVAIISATLMLAAPALAGENKFVFVPRADSPGNDHLRVDNSSLEECERRCDTQSDCNAFTYNQLQSVCLLKYSANRQLTFYAFAVTGVKLFPSVRPTASATESGPSFVILSQADSPGNDYSRLDHSSFEDCRSSCAADDRCNAFTYNHARGVCFLKRVANQWTTFFAWATTGIKLSLQPKEKTPDSEPPQPQVPMPSEEVQVPQPPTERAQP
jgi:PAN domain